MKQQINALNFTEMAGPHHISEGEHTLRCLTTNVFLLDLIIYVLRKQQKPITKRQYKKRTEQNIAKNIFITHLGTTMIHVISCSQ